MPIPIEALLSFLGVSSLVVLSPGPDTMLILRYSFGSGHAVGLAAVVGVQLGLVVHTLSVVFGLSLLVAASPVALRAIAIAGAVYLAWLGIQGLRQADPLGVGAGSVSSKVKAARDGILTNLLNPKVILLFVALLPQFVSPAHGPVAVQLAFLGAIIIVLSAAWQTALALGAERTRRLIARPAVQRFVNRTTAAVFLGFAVLMLYEHAF